MLNGIAAAAIAVWTASAAFCAADLRRPDARLREWALYAGYLALALSVGLAIGVARADSPDALLAVDGVLVVLSVLIGVGLLVVRRSTSLSAMGILVAPASAALLGLFVSLNQSALQPPRHPGAMLTAHIVAATLGLALFGLASFLSALYLLQERQLKKRSFGPLFQRLPSVSELDRLTFRLTIGGFIVYTFALGLGILWAFHIGETGLLVRIYLAIGAWVVFAFVLQTRITTGWRGRQAAWLTILGTAVACAVLALYLVA